MWYVVIKGLFCLFYRIFFRLRVVHYGQEPVEGPGIIISNHISVWDPPLSACGFRRPVHYMAKAELFKYPVLSFVLPRINVFPVRRGTGDRRAVKRSLEILEEGKLLAMFPEGTRSKDGVLQKAEPGAAMFALKTKAPVIPVALINANRIMKPGSFFARLEVRVGEPVDMSEYYDMKASSEVLDKAGEKMMKAIADLLAKTA